MTLYKFKKDPFSSHKRMADCIFEENCKVVLDVGCNVGQLTRALEGWKGEIWGIDFNEEVLKTAEKKYNKTVKIDISRENFPYDQKFDAIVFGDILEHLKNPEETINKFLKNLKTDGIVVISVPNAAHWFMRLSLLLGKFDYEDKGILDKTHLRFFTFKTIKKIIEN